MMDDDTRWQDAAPLNDDAFIGPPKPEMTVHTEAADVDYDELETGIASIFAALHDATSGDASDLPPPEVDEEEASVFEEAHTFQLLGELDRLWLRPSP